MSEDLSHGLHAKWLAFKSKQLIQKAVARGLREKRGFDAPWRPADDMDRARVEEIAKLANPVAKQDVPR